MEVVCIGELVSCHMLDILYWRNICSTLHLGWPYVYDSAFAMVQSLSRPQSIFSILCYFMLQKVNKCKLSIAKKPCLPTIVNEYSTKTRHYDKRVNVQDRIVLNIVLLDLLLLTKLGDLSGSEDTDKWTFESGILLHFCLIFDFSCSTVWEKKKHPKEQIVDVVIKL